MQTEPNYTRRRHADMGKRQTGPTAGATSWRWQKMRAASEAPDARDLREGNASVNERGYQRASESTAIAARAFSASARKGWRPAEDWARQRAAYHKLEQLGATLLYALILVLLKRIEVF